MVDYRFRDSFLYATEEAKMMDDERNERSFRILQEECNWRSPDPNKPRICFASGMACNQKNCMPMKFALYFNRPENRGR